VANCYRHDWDRRCRLLCRQRCLSSLREDGSYLEPNELRGDFAVALIASFRPAVLDRDGTTLDPAEFVQSLHKSSNPLAHGPSGTHAQEADGRHLALLRVRRERPCGRPAKQRDELAPLHSMTSSARSRNDSGIVKPSTLAVVRLRTRSNFVGCSTGRSAG